MPGQFSQFSNYLRWLGWLIIAGLAILVLRTVLPVHAQALVPSTVTLSQTITRPDGTAKDAGTIVYATRSDGAIARLYSAPPQAPTYGGRVLRFPSGMRVYIQDGRQLKSSTLMNGYSFEGSLRLPTLNCLLPKESDLGVENVAGYRARKIQHGNVTTWAAVDHGCAMLQERMDFDDGEVSEKHLVMLQAGDPNPALFDVGPSLSEVPPSRILLGPKEVPNEHTVKADQDYVARHGALMEAFQRGLH